MRPESDKLLLALADLERRILSRSRLIWGCQDLSVWANRYPGFGVWRKTRRDGARFYGLKIGWVRVLVEIGPYRSRAN